jgi:hypothetical protein
MAVIAGMPIYLQHEVAVQGRKAFAAYQAMPIQPFYLFHECTDKMYECTSTACPDLRSLNDNIYVFPR